MHTALLDRSLEALEAVRKHVSFSSNVRNQIGKPSFGCRAVGVKCFDVDTLFGESADPTSWRVIDHCAAITRTYALFESFVLQILREYLLFLSRSYTLTALGADFTAKYTRGLGQILLDKDKQRYRDIDVAQLIAGAHEALADTAGYQIQPEALLRNEQNLRMAELQRLFAQCGLTGIEAWVTSHSAVANFFKDQSRLSETAESELRQIIDYRNAAAHGDVDEVLGAEVLVEFTEFMEALCRCIVDFVQYDTLRRAKELGKATVIGHISERFRDDIVVAKIRDTSIAVGDRLYIYGNKFSMMADIKSIKLNDADVPTATVTAETEVGLRIGVRARINCELIRIE